jgi:CRISPR-associated endonuclease/helicase Cas3
MGKVVQVAYLQAVCPVKNQLPATPAFVHLFAGLIQLADWLGSDSRDGLFAYSQAGEDRVHRSRQRAQHAAHAIGLESQTWRENLHQSPPQFPDVFGVPAPRAMQTSVADPALGQLVVLEAETGSGKTEAALWRFARLF